MDAELVSRTRGAKRRMARRRHKSCCNAHITLYSATSGWLSAVAYTPVHFRMLAHANLKLNNVGRRIRMLEYRVSARRIDAHGSEAAAMQATLTLDTDLNGRPDAFNPAELFLASIAACMIKGIERVAPMIHFQFEGVEVNLHGIRQDTPPMMVAVDYEIIVQTDEDDRRLELLHTNVRKYGTISNTVAKATRLEGSIRRAI